jgi:hypothetical protein
MMFEDDPTNPVEDDDARADLDEGVEDEDLEGGELGLDDEDPEDDVEEVERNGQKYRVPKALAPELMMHADYTRKTQDLAEQRREVEARAAAVADADEEILDHRANLRAIDGQIKQYENVDWDTWDRTDPQAAAAAWRAYERLKDARQRAESDLNKKVGERETEAKRAHQAQLQEARTTLAKEIPGWSPEYANKLTDYGKTIGFSEKELGNVTDPRAIKLLHLAFVGAQATKQGKAARTIQQQQQAKPTPVVGSRGAPKAGLHEKLSAEEWMKRRNAQVAKQRGR